MHPVLRLQGLTGPHTFAAPHSCHSISCSATLCQDQGFIAKPSGTGAPVTDIKSWKAAAAKLDWTVHFLQNSVFSVFTLLPQGEHVLIPPSVAYCCFHELVSELPAPYGRHLGQAERLPRRI